MTGAPAHRSGPDGDWPAARHRDLLIGLKQHLDPDAGLRDIMLHTDHAGFADALARHLDTQAGLEAILPPPPAAAPPRTPAQPGTVAAIAAADPAARMALRRHPFTLAVVLSDLTDRELTIAGKASARGPGIADELVSASSLARDIDLARDVARDLSRDIDRAHSLRLGRDPDHILARDVTREVAGALAHALALVLDLAHILGLGRDLALALGRDLDLDVACALAAGLPRDVADDPTPALALARTRDLAGRTAQLVGDALGLRQVEGLAAALLEGALDDFTHADLTRTDLTVSDQTGIRWSDSGTTWPPGTDTGELRARSREIAPGIYQITRPAHSDQAHHRTHA